MDNQQPVSRISTMDRLKALLHAQDMIPFFLATGQQNRLNIVRILEMIIGSAIIGGIVLYGTVQIIETKIVNIEKIYERDRQETVAWRHYVQEEIGKNRDRIEEVKQSIKP